MSGGTTAEGLNHIVEPIVDSLSQLVLETVGGSLSEVMPHCLQLANSTSQLVDIAQNVAVSTEDEQLTSEIIDIINDLANRIDGLVTNFSSLVQDRTNTTLAKAFAQSSKDVGEAINNLVILSDETSQKRMTSLVRKAVEATKNLEDSILSNNRNKIFSTARECRDMNEKLGN
jgi:predicted ATP-grasp superfamily ATP-dependent carboligase